MKIARLNTFLYWIIIPICTFAAMDILQRAGKVRYFSLTLHSWTGWFWEPLNNFWPVVATLFVVYAMFVKARNYWIPEGPDSPPPKYPLQIANLYWDINNACRGWLITGVTGTGKTVAIVTLMHQFCHAQRGERNPDGTWKIHPWGGVMLDEKGSFWEVAVDVFRYWNRENDLVLLKTRTAEEQNLPSWKPARRLNLLSYDYIPPETYAALIIDTTMQVAQQMGSSAGGGNSHYFMSQAQIAMARGISMMRAVRDVQRAKGCPEESLVYPAMDRIIMLVTRETYYDEFIKNEVTRWAGQTVLQADLIKIERSKDPIEIIRKEIAYFTSNYWVKADEELSGIKGTVETALSFFIADDIAEVFCRDTTDQITSMDQGKVFFIAMPQNLKTERLYINTFLNLFFYQHARSRFDLTKKQRSVLNMLINWRDEGQRSISKQDQDVEILREAMATTVIATQGQPSLIPPLGGKEKAAPILGNLRNRIAFQAFDSECAQMTAGHLGKLEFNKASSSSSSSGLSTSVSREENYIVSPAKLTDAKFLPKFCAMVYHTDGKVRRLYLTPRDPKTNRIAPWWPGSLKTAMGRELMFSIIRTNPKIWFLATFLRIRKPFYILKIPKPRTTPLR